MAERLLFNMDGRILFNLFKYIYYKLILHKLYFSQFNFLLFYARRLNKNKYSGKTLLRKVIMNLVKMCIIPVFFFIYHFHNTLVRHFY